MQCPLKICLYLSQPHPKVSLGFHTFLLSLIFFSPGILFKSFFNDDLWEVNSSSICMELFLFAVGNFLWKSILLTQHNKVGYSCSESPARGGGGGNERKAVIKHFYHWATPLVGFHHWGSSWMGHQKDDKGWIVKYTDQELKTMRGSLSPNKHTLSGEGLLGRPPWLSVLKTDIQ